MTTTESVQNSPGAIQEAGFVIEGTYFFDRGEAFGTQANYEQALVTINDLGELAGITNPTLTLSPPRFNIYLRGIKTEAICRQRLAALVDGKKLDRLLFDKIIDLMQPYLRHGEFGCTQAWSLAAKLIPFSGLTLYVRTK